MLVVAAAPSSLYWTTCWDAVLSRQKVFDNYSGYAIFIRSPIRACFMELQYAEVGPDLTLLDPGVDSTRKEDAKPSEAGAVFPGWRHEASDHANSAKFSRRDRRHSTNDSDDPTIPSQSRPKWCARYA